MTSTAALATSAMTREAWSAALLPSAPVLRSPTTSRIRTEPATGVKVIQVSSQLVVGWSMGLPINGSRTG